MPCTRRSWTMGNSLFCSSGRQRLISSRNTASASQIVAGVRSQSSPPVPIGDRVAHEVVVGQEARVVVAPDEAERLGDPGQQQALARAVRPDEEDRQLGRERADDDRFELVEPDQAEAVEEAGLVGPRA